MDEGGRGHDPDSDYRPDTDTNMANDHLQDTHMANPQDTGTHMASVEARDAAVAAVRGAPSLYTLLPPPHTCTYVPPSLCKRNSHTNSAGYTRRRLANPVHARTTSDGARLRRVLSARRHLQRRERHRPVQVSRGDVARQHSQHHRSDTETKHTCAIYRFTSETSDNMSFAKRQILDCCFKFRHVAISTSDKIVETG